MAMDITEVSPPSAACNKKIIVMGDLLLRYIWEIPAKGERADTVARAILDHWILRFGPPERLLTDRVKVFDGEGSHINVSTTSSPQGIHKSVSQAK